MNLSNKIEMHCALLDIKQNKNDTTVERQDMRIHTSPYLEIVAMLDHQLYNIRLIL